MCMYLQVNFDSKMHICIYICVYVFHVDFVAMLALPEINDHQFPCPQKSVAKTDPS